MEEGGGGAGDGCWSQTQIVSRTEEMPTSSFTFNYHSPSSPYHPHWKVRVPCSVVLPFLHLLQLSPSTRGWMARLSLPLLLACTPDLLPFFCLVLICILFSFHDVSVALSLHLYVSIYVYMYVYLCIFCFFFWVYCWWARRVDTLQLYTHSPTETARQSGSSLRSPQLRHRLFLPSSPPFFYF